MRCPNAVTIFLLLGLMLPAGLRAADSKPVSYHQDLVPLLKRSCTGCHNPGKAKADLDLTSYAQFKKGGRHGSPFVPGDPGKSQVVELISGPEPDMPKEGDPLSPAEVALIERWISEGANDDTPATRAHVFSKEKPPVYPRPPVISALAFSPDGQTLAVSGYHEILLHHADGSGLMDRLIGESPRIESISFSTDGALLAASGGAPALFGEIQIWNLTNHTQLNSFKLSSDSLYGISFSPDGQRLAFGSADKVARIISVQNGKELMRFDNHTDWVFGALFTVSGKRLLTASRDRAMKLIDVANGQFIDDINKLLEGVLCLARHPKDDLVVYGGDLGTARIYKIADNTGRTAANNDSNLVREFERQPGPIHAIAYSLDGNTIAVGSIDGEVRLYKTSDGSRAATLKGGQGAMFAVAFHPRQSLIATGGFDGKVRLFNPTSGELVRAFIPVSLVSEEPGRQAAR